MRKLNRAELSKEFIDDDVASGLTSFFLGAAGGSDRLYATIDRLQPNAYSCKYHAHSGQEEFFYILSGACTLRTEDGQIVMVPGDFFCKPAGKGIAHQFFNHTQEVCEILDVGLKHPLDVIEYPDEGVVYVRALKKVFRLTDALEGWTS